MRGTIFRKNVYSALYRPLVEYSIASANEPKNDYSNANDFQNLALELRIRNTVFVRSIDAHRFSATNNKTDSPLFPDIPRQLFRLGRHDKYLYKQIRRVRN